MSRERSPKADILQGTLDMLLLRILSQEPMHGYAVGKRLREESGDRLRIPQGSLYPALHRLENRGLLSGRKTTIRGREAKVYSITAKGRRRLEQDVSGWEELSVAISLVLGKT